jgi:glycosyltransferase involved in cell wall biosynthesis
VRVAFVLNVVSEGHDGVGDYTLNLASEFHRDGHEVILICSRSEISFQPPFRIISIGGSWQLADFNKAALALKEVNPDWIFLQYIPGAFNRYTVPWLLIYFALRLVRFRTRFITVFHETYVRFDHRKVKYIYISVGQRILAYLLSKFSAQLITSIDRYENQLKRWNKNVTKILIGSNILPVKISDEEILNIRTIVSPSGGPIVSTFGLRNHVPLLNVFQELNKKRPEVTLLICGNLRADIENYAPSLKDHIYITGHQKSEQVFKYLKTSDVFIILDYVSPEGEGGTCNKSGSLAAAFSTGLPIIGTQGDMTNGELINEQALSFVPYNDPFRGSESLLAILNSSEIRNQFKKKSIDFYKSHLQWNTIFLAYKKIIH